MQGFHPEPRPQVPCSSLEAKPWLPGVGQALHHTKPSVSVSEIQDDGYHEEARGFKGLFSL